MSIVSLLQHQRFQKSSTYIIRIDMSTDQENQVKQQGIQTMLQHSNKTKPTAYVYVYV